MPIGTLYFKDTPFFVDTRKGAGPFLAMMPTPHVHAELVRQKRARSGLGADEVLLEDSFLSPEERKLAGGWDGPVDGEPE